MRNQDWVCHLCGHLRSQWGKIFTCKIWLVRLMISVAYQGRAHVHSGYSSHKFSKSVALLCLYYVSLSMVYYWHTLLTHAHCLGMLVNIQHSYYQKHITKGVMPSSQNSGLQLQIREPQVENAAAAQVFKQMDRSFEKIWVRGEDHQMWKTFLFPHMQGQRSEAPIYTLERQDGDKYYGWRTLKRHFLN